jgi:hypothetical protein
MTSVTERVYAQVYSRAEHLYTMDVPDEIFANLIKDMIKVFVG